jgi:hypothetical protein
MSESLLKAATYESGPCYRCPLVKKPNLLGRLLGLQVSANTPLSHCQGKGPETEVVSGAVEVDYRSGQVTMELEDRIVCPKDMTPERHASSDFQQSLIYDRYEEAMDEIERREDYPDSLNALERQTVTARRHIPPVKVLN